MINRGDKNISHIYRGDVPISEVCLGTKTLWPYRPYKYSIIIYAKTPYSSNRPSDESEKTRPWTQYYNMAISFFNFGLLIGGTTNLHTVYLDYNTFGFDSNPPRGKQYYHRCKNHEYYNILKRYPRYHEFPYAMYNNGLLLKLNPVIVHPEFNFPYITRPDQYPNTNFYKIRDVLAGYLYDPFTKWPTPLQGGNQYHGHLANFGNGYPWTRASRSNANVSEHQGVPGLKITWYSDDRDLINDIRGVTFYGMYGYNLSFNRSYMMENTTAKSGMAILMNVKNDEKWSEYLNDKGEIYYKLAGTGNAPVEGEASADRVLNRDINGDVNGEQNQWDADVTLPNITHYQNAFLKVLNNGVVTQDRGALFP